MKGRRKPGTAMTCLIAFAAISGAAFASAPQAWRAKMGELSQALSESIPYLYPDPAQDPKKLTAKVKRIYDITKQLDGKLNHAVAMPDTDPALPYIAGLLKGDIERAYQSLQDGHTEYAKGVVRSSVAYCIACHTRTQGGVEFPVLAAFTEPLKRASWIERIEFQSASRQFDPVVAEVMTQLEKPGTVGISPLDLERGARIALSIAVRSKQDPDRAYLLARAIEKSPSATFAMKEAAKVWIKDISAWRSEKDKKYSDVTEMIAAARRLVQSDGTREPVLGGHEEVRLLRASVLMHEVLKRETKKEQAAEALYIIGLSYDALRELGLWSLHEMYFLTCIEKLPHSAQAELCYARYRESVTLGYTGSSGVHVPKAVRDHLDKVQKLARREGKR